MSSSPLVGTYKRYKAGTEKLVQWLSNSANSCNSAVHADQTKTASKQLPTRKLRVDELIPLAQKVVAARDPKVDITLAILDCAKDTISGRQQSARWYADKGDTQSNSTHRYFLSTLEEIFEILILEAKSRRPKRKKTIELATDTNDLSNIFLRLDLEDTRFEEDEQQLSVESATQRQNQQHVELDLSQEDLEDDARFAVWCMMEDLHNIRLHVRGVWQKYARGDLSLPTTCQITDDAMYQMSATFLEFQKDFPSLITWNQILMLIGLDSYVHSARGAKIWICTSKDHDHHGPSATCHSDRLCMPAWGALQALQDLSDWLQGLPTTGGPLRLTAIHSTHPFGNALLNIAGDLVDLAIGTPRKEANFDIYTRGLLSMVRHGRDTYGPEMLVGTQIYMEIYDVLGGRMDRGMLEATNTIARAAATLEAFDKLHIKCLQDGFDGIGGNDTEPCSGVTVDETFEGLGGWNYQFDPNDAAVVFIPSNVLATLPLYCCRQAFLERANMTILGSRILDENQFLLGLAHLYKGAIAEGSLDVQWEDMDYIISRQNSRGTFVREWEGRDSLLAVAKQYSLSLGVSLSQLAKKEYPTLPSNASCKKNATKMSLTSARVHGLLSTEQNKTILGCYYECARNFMAHCKVSDDEHLAQQWKQTKKLTPCQLLQVVEEALVEDEVSLNFDLLQFARTVIHMAIHASELYFGPDSTDHPYRAVHEILWEAVSAKSTRMKGSSTILHHLGELMKEFIATHGHDLLDQATLLSSGHIPDDKKPRASHGDLSVGLTGPTRCDGLIEIEVGSVFESAYVPTLTETKVLYGAARSCVDLFAKEEHITNDKILEIVHNATSFATRRLLDKGIKRAVHITLGEDLQPHARSIPRAEGAFWQLPAAMMESGLGNGDIDVVLKEMGVDGYHGWL